MQTEVSDCCNAKMIPPDWDMVDKMGSLGRAYACCICKKCGKPCKPTPEIDVIFNKINFDSK